MKTSMLFVIIFIIVAIFYAGLAAFTTIFYKNKFIAHLSNLEIKILNNEATFGDRIKIFFANLFASYAAMPIYIIAALITVIISLIR